MDCNVQVIMSIKDIEDRGYDRLYNNLYSLSIQTSAPCKVTVVDGSSQGCFAEIEKITSLFSFVEHSECKIDIFNKPILYNEAIKKSTAEYLIMTDVDYIYENNFIFEVEKRLNSNNRRLVLCQTLDLPQFADINEGIIRDNYGRLMLSATSHPLYGDGACQASKQKWFNKVGGYDERMALLGGMDNDMHQRAERDGLDICWAHDTTSILHQWHKKTKWISSEQIKQHERNKGILLCDKSIIRNLKEWGEMKG